MADYSIPSWMQPRDTLADFNQGEQTGIGLVRNAQQHAQQQVQMAIQKAQEQRAQALFPLQQHVQELQAQHLATQIQGGLIGQQLETQAAATRNKTAQGISGLAAVDQSDLTQEQKDLEFRRILHDYPQKDVAEAAITIKHNRDTLNERMNQAGLGIMGRFADEAYKFNARSELMAQRHQGAMELINARYAADPKAKIAVANIAGKLLETFRANTPKEAADMAEEIYLNQPPEQGMTQPKTSMLVPMEFRKNFENGKVYLNKRTGKNERYNSSTGQLTEE